MKTIINIKIIIIMFSIFFNPHSLYSVTIKNTAGTTYPATFSNNETVMSIKEKLAKENKWQAKDIQLLWKQHPNQKKAIILQDNYKLIAYGILSNAELIMELKKY